MSTNNATPPPHPVFAVPCPGPQAFALAVVERVLKSNDILLSSTVGIEIGPNEVGQVPHRDSDKYVRARAFGIDLLFLFIVRSAAPRLFFLPSGMLGCAVQRRGRTPRQLAALLPSPPIWSLAPAPATHRH